MMSSRENIVGKLYYNIRNRSIKFNAELREKYL